MNAAYSLRQKYDSHLWLTFLPNGENVLFVLVTAGKALHLDLEKLATAAFARD